MPSQKGKGRTSSAGASSCHGCRPRIYPLLSMLSDFCYSADSRDSTPAEALPHSRSQGASRTASFTFSLFNSVEDSAH